MTNDLLKEIESLRALGFKIEVKRIIYNGTTRIYVDNQLFTHGRDFDAMTNALAGISYGYFKKQTETVVLPVDIAEEIVQIIHAYGDYYLEDYSNEDDEYKGFIRVEETFDNFVDELKKIRATKN